MPASVYVHLDTTSNSLVTKGISHTDFYQSLTHRPENLLLLNPAAEAGNFDPHTGLKVIEGAVNVEDYLKNLQRRKDKSTVEWVDFSDSNMLKELTPQEIAELLYFGHMKVHLRSPFFYKLQNNFAYFELGEDEYNRVFYRYLDEFYRILGDKLVQVTLVRINDRKSFFKRNLPVAKIPNELLRQLKTYLLEGVVFCCSQTEVVNKEYRIPLYIVEDRIFKTEENRFKKETAVAALVYHTGKRTWHFEEEMDFDLSI
ncbi:hypothetical protein [Enterococcus nangangensis]|uniref:hypothetical protein n=1 Tax=Enterococcus nangangensis TaxID=2559926 RepID=UPI0010F58D86|nr:hypothetical protein [Enterococcus nangangensis]